MFNIKLSCKISKSYGQLRSFFIKSHTLPTVTALDEVISTSHLDNCLLTGPLIFSCFPTKSILHNAVRVMFLNHMLKLVWRTLCDTENKFPTLTFKAFHNLAPMYFSHGSSFHFQDF